MVLMALLVLRVQLVQLVRQEQALPFLESMQI
jgi:hypothetical protein